MKRIIEIAWLLFFASSLAEAHSSGGVGGGSGYAVILSPLSRVIYIPGQLDERFEIIRRGATPTTAGRTYTLSDDDFAILQNAQDTRDTFEGQGADGASKSYRIESGTQLNQVELIDRRALIRSEVK